jgi:sulfite exporter TauE/SafE
VTLWAVFGTGLLVGGASCAAVQGGLLAGLIAKRRRIPEPKPAGRGGRRSAAKLAPAPTLVNAEDLVPVGGFLAGKLISHVILGALLGLVGAQVQIGFRVQAFLQLLAGVVMLLMALDLFGVKAVRGLIPAPPGAWTALVRRRARSSAAFAPAALGFSTFLIPCGVTLSMELLAIASGSAVTGALIMGVFVLGTSPLFAVLGYAFRRAGSVFGGSVGKVAAVAVLVVGLITINSGLVLAGLPVRLFRPSDSQAETEGPQEVVSFGEQGSGPAAPALDASGIQTLVLNVGDYGYSPSQMRAHAGVPTKLVLRTNGTQGCTRAFVIPDMRIQKMLQESGDTTLDLGTLEKGRLEFTCSMGMYSGEIVAS